MSEPKQPYKIKDRPPTIFRVVKSKDNPYVMIDRRPIENTTLSFKAKGILTYLLSRPDGWEVSVADLIKRGTDGEKAVRAGLKELKDAGHMKYTTSRKAGRITGWLIEVFEVPDADFVQVENLQVENAGQVLSTLSNKKKTNNIKTAPAAKPSTPSEVKIFREVTERYPNRINFADVALIIQGVSKRLGRECTAEDLRPFYAAWCGKGFKPVNLAWLSWAESGIIPQVSNNFKPRDLIQERYGGIMEWAKEMQENENNLSGIDNNNGTSGGGVPQLKAG